MKYMFDQDGPVMRALSDLSTLVFLNILTALCCIPVVTAGAALAAMLILLAAAVFLYADYRIIGGGQMGLPKAMLVPIYAGMFVLAAVYVYVIPLTAKFVYTTGAAFRNAAILAAAYFPRTIAMVMISAVVPYVLFNVTRLLPLFFLLGLALPAYFCALFYMPVFKKMMGGEEEEEEKPWILEDDDDQDDDQSK